MNGTTIVYGATGGIGEEVARALVLNNKPVHLVARDKNRLEQLAGELNSSYTAGDVMSDSLFDSVAAEAGEVVDGLVYAVGSINLRSLSRFSTEDFLNDLRVNAVGAARAVQAALPGLKKSDGASVVMFSSIAASQGFAMHGSVGMAKGAVNGLTLSLAAELAPRIRVNAIAPSLTRTPLAASMLANEKLVETITAAHPIKRLGTPADISNLTLFLLSEDSGWMTGQIIGVDGGRSTLRTGG